MEVDLVNNNQFLSAKAEYFPDKQKAPENICLLLVLP